MLTDRARMVFSFDAIGFILGLGYVMGLRSSMILCAGGVLSNFVLVPLIWMIGSHITSRRLSRHRPHRADDGGRRSSAATCASSASERSPTAGIFGIIKSLRIVAGSFGVALRAFRRGEAARPASAPTATSPSITILLGSRA